MVRDRRLAGQVDRHDLLGTILIGGESARLSKKLNDEKKLTVGAFGGHGIGQPLVGAGFMLLTAIPKDETHPGDVKDVVAGELAAEGREVVGRLSCPEPNDGVPLRIG